MRKISKFKFYTKTNNLTLKKLPTAICSFYSEKWFKFRALYNKNEKKKIIKKKNKKVKISSFINVAQRYTNIFRWERLKKTFNNKLIIKRLLYILYDKSIGRKYWHSVQHSKTKRHDDFLSAFLLKPYFRIDILLWNLDFFESTYAVKRAIKSKLIFLNNKPVKGPIFVKKGDIISLHSSLFKLNLSKVKGTYISDKKFFPFVEFDYYTNTITIVRDFKELGFYDFPLIIKDFLKIKNWRTNL